jgi:hypothetical protein
MTLGFIDLKAFHALWTDGHGYGPADLEKVNVRSRKQGDYWPVAKVVANLYVKAAAQVGSQTCDGPLSLTVSYLEGGRITFDPAELIAADEAGFHIHTGSHVATGQVQEKNGAKKALAGRGLQGRLWINSRGEPKPTQRWFSHLVQASDQRCHLWSSLRQLALASFIGAVIRVAARGTFLDIKLASLAAGCGILYLYARSQHTQWAQVSGFWYAASLALAKKGTDKSWCVAKGFREPLDPWALKIGKGFLARGAGYPQSAQEALEARKRVK